jgi:hypothetical protein
VLQLLDPSTRERILISLTFLSLSCCSPHRCSTMSSASTSSSVQTFVQRNKQVILLGAAAVLVVAGGLAYNSYSAAPPAQRPGSPKGAKDKGKKSKSKGTTATSTPIEGEKEQLPKSSSDVVQDGQSTAALSGVRGGWERIARAGEARCQSGGTGGASTTSEGSFSPSTRSDEREEQWEESTPIEYRDGYDAWRNCRA